MATEWRVLLGTARAEASKVRSLPKSIRSRCVYCGALATCADHLLPTPWTGTAGRKSVPTVPACHPCNLTLGDLLDPTIVGRALHVAAGRKRGYSAERQTVLEMGGLPTWSVTPPAKRAIHVGECVACVDCGRQWVETNARRLNEAPSGGRLERCDPCRRARRLALEAARKRRARRSRAEAQSAPTPLPAPSEAVLGDPGYRCPACEWAGGRGCGCQTPAETSRTRRLDAAKRVTA